MSNRRDFLKAAVTAVAATNAGLYAAAGNETIKVGLIGCGSRGKRAILDCLQAERAINKDNPKVEIVAVADAFEDQTKNAVKTFTNEKSEDYGSFVKQVKITPDTTFSGLDAYQKLLATDVNLVILATPPGFRPYHLEAAVKAKKNIFCEKPVAVDATGARKCYGLVEESKKANLAIVAGTQRRHQKAYIEVMKKVHDGALGEFRAARCAWNGREPWYKKREAGQEDSTYQLRNWYHYLWACGDHIVEQHVHNLDVINWALNDHPIRATGFGGRSFRHPGGPKEGGNIWDHFAVEFEYKNGVRLSSYCRHFPVGGDDVSETVIGTKATMFTRDGSAFQIGGKEAGEDDRVLTGYVREHIDLLNSIRAGAPLNELKNVTDATFTAILGRNVCYSGNAMKWDDALAMNDDTMPKDYALDKALEAAAVPRPGTWKPARA